MNLFIIGNGFDLQHGLETSFLDFAVFLYKTYTQPSEMLKANQFFAKLDSILQNAPYIFDLRHKRDKDNIEMREIEDSDAALFLLMVISECTSEDTPIHNWANLEKSLGNIDYTYLFEKYGPYETGNDGDREMSEVVHFNQAYTESWIKAFEQLNKYYTEWILEFSQEYKSSTKQNIFEALFAFEKNVFINFNYTYTLEEIYNQHDDDVLHIHGDAKHPNSIIWGHGSKNRYEDPDYYDDSYIGAQENLREITNSTKKPLQLTKLEKLSLDNVKKVISYGFSFGDVDMPYIERLLQNSNVKNAEWHIIENLKNSPSSDDAISAKAKIAKLLNYGVQNPKSIIGRKELIEIFFMDDTPSLNNLLR